MWKWQITIYKGYKILFANFFNANFRMRALKMRDMAIMQEQYLHTLKSTIILKTKKNAKFNCWKLYFEKNWKPNYGLF